MRSARIGGQRACFTHTLHILASEASWRGSEGECENDSRGTAQTQQELVLGNAPLDTKRAVRHPRMAERALPGRRADNRAPLLQGYPISGLDAHKAKRLA